ncbi:MAG: TPM domain-containing protein [Bdellovibrionales bacterium]|nr:TPM domain-containing protein [Bdellovibrionales bacterium]
MNAIRIAEAGTSGEIRVHLSYSKNDQDLLKCAESLFQKLGMQNTRLRNSVLLYLNPKLKKFSIYGDQGIHEKVGPEFWTNLAKEVSIHIREKDITDGIVYAVAAIGAALKEHFPALEENPNEISDELTED